MPCKNVATLLFCFAAPTLGARRHSSSFASLRSDLQPEVVAMTLSKVEQDWRGEAGSYVRCTNENSTDCTAPINRFQTSCATVVTAVLKASGGERNTVQEYLGEVCTQGTLEGWRGEACHNLTTALLGSMSTIASANREDMNVVTPCEAFWTALISTERNNMEKELAEEAAEEQRRQKEEQRLRKEEQDAAKQRETERKKRQEEERKEREAKAAQAAKEAAAQEAEANRTQALLNSVQQVSDKAQEAESSASDQLGAAKADMDALAARNAARKNATAPNATASNATAANSTAAPANHTK